MLQSFTLVSSLANVEFSNRRIVVRNLLSCSHPSVDMNMLVLCLWLESLADEHVIKLLAVHVEEVRVSLELRDVRSLVKISEIGDLLEVLERLDKGKLVEVTSDDDLGILILGKDVGNKLLCLMSNKSRMNHLG